MTKKFLTAVGILILTLLIITGCNKQIVAEYELANDATVRLYQNGDCTYEETITTRYVNDISYFSNSEPGKYSPSTGSVTYTITKTYSGKYKKTDDNTYSLIFTSEKTQVDHVTDAQNVVGLDDNDLENSLSLYVYISGTDLSKMIDTKSIDVNTTIFNRDGYALDIQLNENGQISKHVKKHPGYEFEYIGASTEPSRYDEYLYYYDKNGKLDYYEMSQDNSIYNDQLERFFYKCDVNNGNLISKEKIGGSRKYEYTYYANGAVKSRSIFSNNVLQEKKEYFEDGFLSSVYTTQYDGHYYIKELDKESNRIIYHYYDENNDLTSVKIFEYNDDGTIKAIKKGKSPDDPDIESTNYTYNISKHLNGNISSVDTYTNGSLSSRKVYHKSGKIKESYTYAENSFSCSLYNEVSELIETRFGVSEDCITTIRKYDPIISDEIQTLKRDSVDEEFTVTDHFEITYDNKTGNKTLTRLESRFSEINVYVIDKNSRIISIDTYKYNDTITTSLEKRYLQKIVDNNTLECEFYNHNNELIYKLYYRFSKDGVTIEPEIIK